MEKLVLKNIARKGKGLFSERKWRSFWAKDWVLKMLSLFFATILWYFVVGEDTVDKNVMVPVEIINLPRDLVVSNQFKKEIEVTVSGPRSLIQEMTERGLTRQIDLSEALPGTRVIQNDNESIRMPRGITVLRVQPASIILSLDKLIQKQFQVMPVTTGDVATGFELESLQMTPDGITITGPQTTLSAVDALLTEIIDINGMRESRQIQIPLDLNPSIVDLIGETSVTADIVIQPKSIQKRISSIPVEAYIGGSQRIVSPDTIDVVANIPVLLIRETENLNSLLSATAIAGDGDVDFLKVSVIPREDVKLPIEVVSILPDQVRLVKSNPNGSEQSPSNSETEQVEVIEPNQNSSTIESEEGVGAETDAVQIKAVKRKKIR